MPKTIVLKSRLKGSWRDDVVINNAIETIVEGMKFSKAAMWMDIAGRMELAMEAATVEGKSADAPVDAVSVDLSNTQARVMWREFEKLPLDAFGRKQSIKETVRGSVPVVERAIPPLSTLYAMLSDIAAAIGEKMPEYDEEIIDGTVTEQI